MSIRGLPHLLLPWSSPLDEHPRLPHLLLPQAGSLHEHPRATTPSSTSSRPFSSSFSTHFTWDKFTMWIEGEINHLCTRNQTATRCIWGENACYETTMCVSFQPGSRRCMLPNYMHNIVFTMYSHSHAQLSRAPKKKKNIEATKRIIDLHMIYIVIRDSCVVSQLISSCLLIVGILPKDQSSH